MKTKLNLTTWVVIFMATIFSMQLQAQGINGTFNVSSDWGTGYCAEIVITNNTSETINGWTYIFDQAAEITSFWNVGSWSGNQSQGYSSTDAGWNSVINPGESVTLGYCANYSIVIQPPINAYINDISVDFGGGGSQTSPTINITNPTEGAVIMLNTTVELKANASDTDGSITSVYFEIDGQSIAGVNTQGNIWEADWISNNIGNYSIIATATDNDNLVTSTTSSITIQNNPGGNNLVLSALPLQINFNVNESITYAFDQVITAVLSRNINVVDITISGNEVTLTGIVPGRTGLRIITDGEDYFMGLRVNHNDGTIPGMPDYLSVGSVSEDSQGDLAFWKDVNIGEQNKSMDIRYIYINGGPITGWQTWGPNRPETFATESLRFGLIPFFVYYNIPDGGESYYTNTLHINDVDYMTAYFNDLNNFMDKAESVLQGELYGIILEPDFLGYIQQNGDPSDPELVPTCVAPDNIAPEAGTLRTLVERINSTIDSKRAEGHNIFYGWQLNLWSYPITGAPQGVIRLTDQLGFDAGRSQIQNAAEQTTLYGIQAGVLSSNPNFLSIDKYGLDAMGHQNTPNPANSTWFFNNDHWMNYLYYAQTMYETSGFPIILWQLPVGHINNSNNISSYTGNTFTPLPNTTTKFEDSSTPFFFGDTFNADSPDRLSYFTENQYADTALQVVVNNITWDNHMQQVKDAGIISTLFGAGVGISTDGIGNPATDDYFWVQKVQNYYLDGPINLDWNMFNICDGGCPPNVSITSPIDGGEVVISQLSSINIDITAWDQDGQLNSLTVEIDGQIFQLETTGYTHTLSWTPEDFGVYVITSVATDNDGFTTSESITFSVVEFDPDACGVPIWVSDVVYAQPGTQVSWNGNIYENKWWTSGDQPGVGGWSDPWEFITQCTSSSGLPSGILNSNTFDNLKLKLFPNPASQQVAISFYTTDVEKVQVIIFNIKGERIMETILQSSASGTNTHMVNISEFAKGIYGVSVIAKNKVSTKKLVVTN